MFVLASVMCFWEEMPAKASVREEDIDEEDMDIVTVIVEEVEATIVKMEVAVIMEAMMVDVTTTVEEEMMAVIVEGAMIVVEMMSKAKNKITSVSTVPSNNVFKVSTC